MKYPSEHKANTRQRVLSEAAKAIRAEGVEGLSIASVMAAAGLTVGGFYAHFKSRDELVAEAVNFMFESRYAHFFVSADTPHPHEVLTRLLDAYLSMRHRDSLLGGCPLPVLAGQVPHLPEAARERFFQGLERLTLTVSRLLEALGTTDAAGTARVALAEMMGALSLSRVTRDPVAAQSLLESSHHAVSRRLGLSAA